MAEKAPAHQENFPRRFGKYYLLAPLAQGGMGALYLAVSGDRGFERLMVIKTVLPHLADKEYVARFRDEAKIVVKLNHGNLVPVFDAGQVDDELFLAMDFVEGKDLRAVWNRCAQKGVAFPVDIAVFMIKELCRGLSYAHSYGDLRLVHRDISPPNVLISYAGEVRLTDFGLASSTLKLEKTAPGIVYGKVAYMSPEQARGESLDCRSDVFAAGTILWELLTGRQLFPPGKESPADLLKRARQPVVIPPSQKAPRVTTDLDAICLRALAVDKDARFQNAASFRDALAEWLAKQSPLCDGAKLEHFVRGLFAEDILSEQQERDAMLIKTRDRAVTMAPTDDLRRMTELGAKDLLAAADRRRQQAENLGRRDLDQGQSAADRRQAMGRRIVDRIPGRNEMGQLYEVPTSSNGMTVALPGGTSVDPQTSSSANDLLGQTLDGRYRIDELIGEGGMGRVYLAEHIELGKRVAVKVLHPVYSKMPDLVERFRREARAASKIGNPHIVEVHDSGTTQDGSVYFVMEHLEGAELATMVQLEGALPLERGLEIVRQICQALAAAHVSGVIHRDLKPENIFLTVRHGVPDFVKVLDFGIAKTTETLAVRAEKLTSPGMAMGTPEYMAPEQAAGKVADERCDIYAVGAILYEVMTGVPPYRGENFMEILAKKATHEPTPPRQLRPEIPSMIEDLILRAMSRNPEGRPETMDALGREIQLLVARLGGRTDSTKPISTEPILPVFPQPSKSWLRLSVVATLLLALVAATWGLLFAIRDKKEPTIANSPTVSQPSRNTIAPPSALMAAKPTAELDATAPHPQAETAASRPKSSPSPRVDNSLSDASEAKQAEKRRREELRADVDQAMENGHWPDAIEKISEIKKFDSGEKVQLKLTRAYFETGNYNKAWDAAKLAGNSQTALDLRFAIAMKRNDGESACQAAKALLKVRPDHPQASKRIENCQ